jgi:hypothetical protein
MRIERRAERERRSCSLTTGLKPLPRFRFFPGAPGEMKALEPAVPGGGETISRHGTHCTTGGDARLHFLRFAPGE